MITWLGWAPPGISAKKGAPAPLASAPGGSAGCSQPHRILVHGVVLPPVRRALSWGVLSAPASLAARAAGFGLPPSSRRPVLRAMGADGEGQAGSGSLPRDGKYPSPARRPSTGGSEQLSCSACLVWSLSRPLLPASPSYCPQVWEIPCAPQRRSLPSALPRAAPRPAPMGLTAPPFPH